MTDPIDEAIAEDQERARDDRIRQIIAGGFLRERILEDIRKHREVQIAQYGTNDDLEDGTGPHTLWLRELSFDDAREIERKLRHDYQLHSHIYGKPTWMHLVREEVAEAFKESDTDRLREELIQVAALCVSWIETLDARP